MKYLTLILLVGLQSTAWGDACASSLIPTFTANQATSICKATGSNINHNLIPLDNNLYDLGSAAKAWKTAYFGTSVLFSASAFEIAATTADAADTKRMQITGGGSSEISRGAYLYLYGNESGSSTKGDWYLRSGDVSTNGGNGHISARNTLLIQKNESGYQDNWTFDLVTGEFIGAGTGSIGWAVISGADTACVTTCTTPCVFGVNTDSLTADIVGCADGSADKCLCAGAS